MSGRCDSCGHVGDVYCEDCAGAGPAELRGAHAEGAAAEREACAELFEAEIDEGLADMTFREWCEWMTARIRARGEPKCPHGYETAAVCPECGTAAMRERMAVAKARGREASKDATREHVKEGLADSAAGRVSSLGSFAQYAEDGATSARLKRAEELLRRTQKLADGANQGPHSERNDEWRIPWTPECVSLFADVAAFLAEASPKPSAPDDAKEKALAALRELTAEFRRFGPRVSLQYEEPTFEATLSESWLARLDEAIAALEGK